MATKGRPKIEIDWDSAERLAVLHCTGEEIAAFLKVSYDTLVRRIKREFKLTFAEWLKRNSAGGKISLRRSQFKAANNGNITMLIWLGKQWLGQSDIPVVNESTEDNKDLEALANLIDSLEVRKPDDA